MGEYNSESHGAIYVVNSNDCDWMHDPKEVIDRMIGKIALTSLAIILVKQNISSSKTSIISHGIGHMFSGSTLQSHFSTCMATSNLSQYDESNLFCLQSSLPSRICTESFNRSPLERIRSDSSDPKELQLFLSLSLSSWYPAANRAASVSSSQSKRAPHVYEQNSDKTRFHEIRFTQPADVTQRCCHWGGETVAPAAEQFPSPTKPTKAILLLS